MSTRSPSKADRDAVLFEAAAEEFSRRRGIERVCVGPQGAGCPERITDPLILDIAHIGGGGSHEREALKRFTREHGGRVPNERPGGLVYLQMLHWAETRGYISKARLGWQCPNCNQREQRAEIIAARRRAREQLKDLQS